MLKKGYYIVRNFCWLLLSIFTIEGATAQNIDLSLKDQLDCSTNTYCVSIQVQSNAGELSIGTSSIFLHYNTAALSYANYTSSHFDGREQCIQGIASAWDIQTYDATSAPGFFNLTMTLLKKDFSCPAVGTAAIEVGTLCFDVINKNKSPNIKISKSHTSFNRNQPNTGAKAIPVGTVARLNDATALQCETATSTVDCANGRNKELWQESTVELTIENCEEVATFCTGIAFNSQGSYELLVNEIPITAHESCETGQTTFFYTYTSLLKLEEEGEFEVTSWSVDGKPYKGTFNNTAELMTLLKKWDEKGNWSLDPVSNAIQGGVANKKYGPIAIKNRASGLSIMMGLNKKVSAANASITLKEGIHQLVATNRYTNCQDAIEVQVICKNALAAEERVDQKTSQELTISADTTICLDQLLTANSFIEDCSDNLGKHSNLSVENQTNCLKIMATDTGTDVYCLYVCDEDDNCTTLTLTVNIVQQATPILRDDLISVMMNEETTIEVTDNDLINGAIMDFGVPYQRMDGTINVDQDIQSVTYISAYDACGVQDSFQYYIVNESGKSLATVKVEVLCEDLTVYSGFSPNGDGINDYFKIMGIENFEENELIIFNSRGNEIYAKRGYQNEDGWDGTWKGETLPDGTYFYMLTIESRPPMSGYVQIQR